MTDAPLTLPEFLLARIAEDEAAAKGMLPPSPWVYATHPAYEGDDNWAMSEHHVRYVESDGPYECRVADVWHEHVARFIVRNADPSRVLAECEAKRRIVEEWFDPTPDFDGDVHMTDDASRLFRLLALPYADHEDYRPEWKP